MVVIGLLAAGLSWAWSEGPLRDPEAALADFVNAQHRAEDQLMDPLILAGPRVIPVVIEAVANPEMPRRRYAITFLGRAGRREAIPVLDAIVANVEESDLLRADALGALYRIDAARAADVAQSVSDRPDQLGRVSRAVLFQEVEPSFERSWWEAFLGVHH